jgi:hypothetical protein
MEGLVHGGLLNQFENETPMTARRQKGRLKLAALDARLFFGEGRFLKHIYKSISYGHIFE